MEWLYLLRHGVAVDHGTPGFVDDDRPLTARGAGQVARVARALRRLKPRPDGIVTSPLPRAKRTAEILAEILDADSVLATDDVLRPERRAAEIREWMTGRAEGRLILVGHNPNLSALLSLLVTGSEGASGLELRKGGLAALRAGDEGGFVLDWLARPRLVRAWQR